MKKQREFDDYSLPELRESMYRAREESTHCQTTIGRQATQARAKRMEKEITRREKAEQRKHPATQEKRDPTP